MCSCASDFEVKKGIPLKANVGSRANPMLGSLPGLLVSNDRSKYFRFPRSDPRVEPGDGVSEEH